MSTESQLPLQPLPNHVQEGVWDFVSRSITVYENGVGAKVAKFEIHVTGSGQIEIEVLATETTEDASIDLGLEDAGLKSEPNRMKLRERLSEDVE